eukprot:10833383-Ditylum_brightwellii.AAC.1
MMPKRSKAINMRFHWLKCKEAQHQFNIKWRKEESNKADYHSKHHPPKMHQQQQMHYVTNAAVVQNIKNVTRCMRKVLTSQARTGGCAKALPGLNRVESLYGFNPVGWMTTRQQKTNKPSRIKH